MPAFDVNLMFRNTTGVLTASASSPNQLTIRGTAIKGLAARVVVPSRPNTTSWGGVRPEYWDSADGTTWRLCARYSGDPTITANGQTLITPIVTPHKYVYEFLRIMGTWTYGYGAIQSGLVTGVGFDWTRAVDVS